MTRFRLLPIAVLFAMAACAQGPGGPPPPGGGPGGPGGPGQQGDGIWQRNAYFGERETFDACFGHQPGNGQYHHHVQPVCLRAQLGDNLVLVASGRTGSTYQEKSGGLQHSPILGWSFDGYPVYGPYGFSDPANAASAIRRMKSGFRLRSITGRTSLPDWSLNYHTGIVAQLTAAQQGPPVNARFPLGRYVEDFEYAAGTGDLDQYNGRFAVTPQFPKGTYAYYVTINEDGSPAFPYIFGLEYNGAATGGVARTIPADAQDYFINRIPAGANSQDPFLASLFTARTALPASAVIAWDPAAGPQASWPGTVPAGIQTSGGVAGAVSPDVQRIRFNETSVFVNSNGLPSYTIGPWFASMNGGIFMNFPSQQNDQQQIPRTPQTATTRAKTGLGAVGIWVNGVAAFNMLDGASYRTSTGADVGGGIVATTAAHVSSASLEGGPVAPGTLVTAYANFDAVLATATAQANSAVWPTTLGGATVTIRDSTGTAYPAPIAYASAGQVNYQVPSTVAPGVATVTIAAGGNSVPGGLYVVPTYPGIFKQSADGLAAAQVARVVNGKVEVTTVSGAVSPGDASQQATLILYGTGLNGATKVTATIGEQPATVTYAGPQGTYSGLDQYNVLIPQSVAGRGKVSIVVTAAGKPSNPVYIVAQ